MHVRLAQPRLPVGRLLWAVTALVGLGGAARGLEHPVRPESAPQLPPAAAVDFSTLELRLFADAADHRLDEHTLLEAALVASGVATQAEICDLVQKVEQRIVGWRNEGLAGQPYERRVEMLLTLMHRDLLTGGYRHDCSNLSELLVAGRFNCVSATVLWQCLAEAFELPSTAVESPGHVHAQVVVAGQTTEVETTCPRWFEMLDDPAGQHAARARVRSQTATAATTISGCRRLDALGLLAAIYYNRGTEAFQGKQFAEAVAANAKALRLDADSVIAQGNLRAALNNWVLHLGSQGDFEQATELLAQSRRMAPEHELFEVNYVALHQQWIDRLIAEERFAEALALSQRIAQELPGQRFFVAIQVEIRARIGGLKSPGVATPGLAH